MNPSDLEFNVYVDVGYRNFATHPLMAKVLIKQT